MSNEDPAPPEPPVPLLVRAQVVFQAASNLPEDRYVNVFHFARPVGVSFLLAAPLIAAKVRNVYETAAAPATTAVGTYFASWVNRPYSVKMYDMSIPSGDRVPITVAGTLPTSVSTVNLPGELAVALSFRGPAPAGPRERGRVYMGPWSTAALPAAAGTDPAVNNVLQDSMRYAGNRLADEIIALAAGYQWVIYSRTNDVMVNVAWGWVDDAFDVIRKRGRKAVSRAEFSV